MITIGARLDKTEVFCDADDFYADFEQNYQNQLKLLLLIPMTESQSRT